MRDVAPGSGMSQRPSAVLRVPARTQALSLKISIFFLSSIAMQLSSHSWPIDSKEALVIPARTWAVFARTENTGGKGRWPACVA
jgi:hypothetical protein